MKSIIFVLVLSFIVCGNVFADKQITVTLDNEQYDALTILPNETPEEAAQRMVEYKADRLIDALVREYSDKQPSKMTKQEKKDLVNAIDLVEEKRKRKEGK